MSTINILSLATAAGLLIASTTAYVTHTSVEGAETRDAFHSSFGAEIRGDVATRLGGTAQFGAVPSETGAGVFTLALGAWDTAGAVVFTRTDRQPLTPGTYVVSDLGEGSGAVRALVVTGPPSDPTGAFRGRSGLLTVATASDSAMTGTFDLHATGFLARDPENESRRIEVTGTFTAVREPAATPDTSAGA